MTPALRGGLAFWGAIAVAMAASAQTSLPLASSSAASSLFRVFLRDGTALPAVGDSAVVGDRLVFTLAVGGDTDVRMQLMSLPTSSIDLDKTSRYARSIRAAHYAATRGESDYEAMTHEVSGALDYLTTVSDPRERLRLAEEARRRLMDWSQENYRYRASDIATLAGLFDEVIAELRAAAGESSFTLDLSTGASSPDLQALLPAPSLRESITMALAAARAADVSEERLAILRTALAALEGVTEDGAGLRIDVTRELDIELAMGEAYRLLGEDLLARADAAADRGDAAAFAAVRADLASRDTALGRRRPADVVALSTRIAIAFERAVARRMSLDRFAAARAEIYAYERLVRPAMSGVDGLRPVLEHLRDQKFFNFQRLENSIARFSSFIALARDITPPDETADVHATLMSALYMAQQASARRRLAVVTKNPAFDLEASAAAAGALMLADQVRKELIARMMPGRAAR